MVCWFCDGLSCTICKRIAATTSDNLPKTHPLLHGYCTELELPETKRLTQTHYYHTSLFTDMNRNRKRKAEKSVVCSTRDGSLFKQIQKRCRTVQAAPQIGLRLTVPLGVARLLKFLALLAFFGTATWADIRFEENERMLKRFTAAHLGLIVGHAEAKEHKSALLAMIDATENMFSIQHLIWVTNRQNGKTTTLGRFLATLAILSPAGGNLVYVYSITQDRAQELIEGAHRYIQWVKTDAAAIATVKGYGIVVGDYTTKNTQRFSIRSATNTAVINTIKARPRTTDSCRGDAPQAVMVDEMGFVTAEWWYQFAYPLAQVGDRIFTMATTPSAEQSFFSALVKKVVENCKKGSMLFQLVNHTVICEACQESQLHEKCCHMLGNIPSWKTVLGFNAMKNLVPAKKMEDFRKEVYGIIKTAGGNYYAIDLLNKFITIRNSHPMVHVPARPTVFICVDPPSHGVSFGGFTASMYCAKGQFFILGMAEIKIEMANMTELVHVTSMFTLRVLQQLTILNIALPTVRVIAIVEGNNNTFQSNDIVKGISTTAIGLGARFEMPFVKEVFPRGIVEHIGVRTGNVEKHGGIQTVHMFMAENRLCFWDRMVTLGPAHMANYTDPTKTEVIDVLFEQLAEFKEGDNGPSGKTSSTNDDIASALHMNAYYSFCINMIEAMDGNRNTTMIPRKRKGDVLVATEHQAKMARRLKNPDWS